MNLVDPEGMDWYIFDSNGNNTGKVEHGGTHRILVVSKDENDNIHYHFYDFADPDNDPTAIDNGEINKLEFVSDDIIYSMLNNQEAFTASLIDFISGSSSAGLNEKNMFDYSASELFARYDGYIKQIGKVKELSS